MSRTGELSVSPYYSYSRAPTPLWLILLGETYNWTGDDGLVERYWPNALAALDWIDKWGDRDGDGFVDAERRAETGLRNQGWKDSTDSIRWLDGGLAETPSRWPRYGLRLRREAADGEARRHRGDTGPGRSARDRGTRPSSTVQQPVPPSGWLDRHGPRSLEATGWTPLARMPVTAPVDRDGPTGAGGGHSGRPRNQRDGLGLRPAHVCRRTTGLQPDRLPPRHDLAHDTGIGAAGLRDTASTTRRAPCPAASWRRSKHSAAFRLPELFCGFDRAAAGPVPYPVACSPQAWAAEPR